MSSFDMERLMQQAAQMQEQVQRMQDEAAQETAQSSVGGGLVKVTANGAGDVVAIEISPDAIDPDDPDPLGTRRAGRCQGCPARHHHLLHRASHGVGAAQLHGPQAATNRFSDLPDRVLRERHRHPLGPGGRRGEGAADARRYGSRRSRAPRARRVSTPPPPGRRSVRGRYLFSNWLWALIVLALIGVVIWGWAFDFSPR